ncbi:hypothetical protein BW247_11115 [Acidihalobacter ferrooxydans]|uniref:Lysine transporter LysE n=1 Tax=Acidihalobacter ferrooxydans TaxID=1765967 RepID=A0A1P8ULH7_9GAMM|nr:hypothetical protein BW247_11115 [Acidihalobacter ferrooxydans]
MNLLPLLGFAVATAATPGPVNTLAAMSGARYGLGRSLAYVMGAASGFTALLALTGLGLAGIAAAAPWVTRAMTLAGAAYMLYLAARITVTRAQENGAAPQRPPGYLNGVVAQWLNPKAWIVAVSAVSIFVTPHTDQAMALSLFCATYFVVCLLAVGLWASLGRFASGLLGDAGRFNQAMAVLMVASILYLVFAGFA